MKHALLATLHYFFYFTTRALRDIAQDNLPNAFLQPKLQPRRRGKKDLSYLFQPYLFYFLNSKAVAIAELYPSYSLIYGDWEHNKSEFMSHPNFEGGFQEQLERANALIY